MVLFLFLLLWEEVRRRRSFQWIHRKMFCAVALVEFEMLVKFKASLLDLSHF